MTRDERYQRRCELDQLRIERMKNSDTFFDPSEMRAAYPEQHVHQHRATPKNDDAIQLGDSLVGQLFHLSRVASVNSAMAA